MTYDPSYGFYRQPQVETSYTTIIKFVFRIFSSSRSWERVPPSLFVPSSSILSIAVFLLFPRVLMKIQRHGSCELYVSE